MSRHHGYKHKTQKFKIISDFTNSETPQEGKNDEAFLQELFQEIIEAMINPESGKDLNALSHSISELTIYSSQALHQAIDILEDIMFGTDKNEFSAGIKPQYPNQYPRSISIWMLTDFISKQLDLANPPAQYMARFRILDMIYDGGKLLVNLNLFKEINPLNNNIQDLLPRLLDWEIPEGAGYRSEYYRKLWAVYQLMANQAWSLHNIAGYAERQNEIPQEFRGTEKETRLSLSPDFFPEFTADCLTEEDRDAVRFYFGNHISREELAGRLAAEKKRGIGAWRKITYFQMDDYLDVYYGSISRAISLIILEECGFDVSHFHYFTQSDYNIQDRKSFRTLSMEDFNENQRNLVIKDYRGIILNFLMTAPPEHISRVFDDYSVRHVLLWRNTAYLLGQNPSDFRCFGFCQNSIERKLHADVFIFPDDFWIYGRENPVRDSKFQAYAPGFLLALHDKTSTGTATINFPRVLNRFIALLKKTKFADEPEGPAHLGYQKFTLNNGLKVFGFYFYMLRTTFGREPV